MGPNVLIVGIIVKSVHLWADARHARMVIICQTINAQNVWKIVEYVEMEVIAVSVYMKNSISMELIVSNANNFVGVA